MLILGRSWRAKNAPKLSSKYLKDRICKIKQYLNYILMIINQNILAILRTFLNLQKYLWKTLHEQKQPPEMFYKKDVFKNFINLTGKHQCQSLFLNNFITILLKKRLWTFFTTPWNDCFWHQVNFHSSYYWIS